MKKTQNSGKTCEMLGLWILIRFVSSKNICLINRFPRREIQTIITPWIIRQNGHTPRYACAQQASLASLALPMVLISINCYSGPYTAAVYYSGKKLSLTEHNNCRHQNAVWDTMASGRVYTKQ